MVSPWGDQSPPASEGLVHVRHCSRTSVAARWAVLNELSPLHRNLRRAVPAVYQGFGDLHQAAFAAGALDTRTKELIALAIGVVEGCDGCIASHAQAAARAGATAKKPRRRSVSRS